MTDDIHIYLSSSSEHALLPANPPPQCKEVVDSLGGGILLEGDTPVLHSRILEAGKQYTFKNVTTGEVFLGYIQITVFLGASQHS